MDHAKTRFVIYILFSIFILHLYMFFHFQVDDSFISLRYAKNLAEGDGFRFNIGLPPVEGYSNFLWVVIAAILFFFQVSSNNVTLVINVISSIALFAGVYRLGRSLGCSGQYNLISLVLLTSSSSIAVASGIGLETPLFSALLIWALAFAIEELNYPARFSRALPLFWLLSLTRLEGIAYLIIYSLVFFLSHIRTKFSKTSLQGGIWLVLYAVYTGWRIYYFNGFLPNTYVAKLNTLLAILRPGIHDFLDFILIEGGWVLFALAILGVLAYTPRKITGLLLGCVVLQVVIAVRAGGDWMPGHRMYVPVLPIIFLLAQIAVIKILETGAADLFDDKSKIIFIFFALSLMLINTVSQDFLVYKHHSWRHERKVIYTDIGNFLKQHGEKTDSIALVDIGAIGFHSDLSVIDLGGLTDSKISRLPRFSHLDYTDQGLQELVDHVKQLNPRFIGVTPGRFNIEVALSNDKTILMQYDVVRTNRYITLYKRKPAIAN